MPRILISNIHLRDYGGSEMVTLELAEEFVERGWEVDIYTSLPGKPFLPEFDHLLERGLRVSSDPSAFGSSDYDLMWIHHSLLPVSAIRRIMQRGVLPPIIWNHMSAFADFELPHIADIEAQAASIITFVSPEAKKALVPYGLPESKCELLRNPAPRAFTASEVNPAGAKLRTVLLVSNHPPRELAEASELLKGQGIEVLKVGEEKPQRMTADLVDACDAVVTIGKTTQYALSLAKPVYEYDHFGGCGWIDESNFDEEFDANFSGRATRRHLTSTEISHEIMAGYPLARQFAIDKVSTHRRLFSLELQIDRLLAKLETIPRAVLNEGALLRWEAHSRLLSSLYSSFRMANSKITELEVAATAQAEEEASQREALEEQLSSSREEVSRLMNSKALRLGQKILGPIYYAQRLRSARKSR